MKELYRGTWFYFGESMVHIPVLFLIIIPNLYAEIQKSKSKHLKVNLRQFYLKSIPFLVYLSMFFASIFRIGTGIAAYFHNSKQMVEDPITFALWVWSIQFMIYEYYFVELLWIKLATVFYSKDNDLPLNRMRIIDRIVIGNMIASFIFHILFAILQGVFYDPFGDRNWWDTIWRIYFLGYVTLIALSLGYFGIQILLHFTRKRTMDTHLKKKIQAVLVLTFFLGPTLWVVNVLYIMYKDDTRDWINLSIFSLEIINVIWVSIILGRSSVWRRIRVHLGFPEMIDEKETKTTSGEISLKKTISFENTQTLDASFIDVSSDQIGMEDQISMNSMSGLV